MDRKYQVFVSSTYADLIAERQDILKVILDLGQVPAGMEGFYAADQEQLTYIKQIIDECDYYVLVVAGRYGSVDEVGVSFTEREYDYAVEKGVTVLAFIHKDTSTLPAGNVDTQTDVVERLNAFKNRVGHGRLVSFWSDKNELKSNVTISLSKVMRSTPRIGWVRGNVAASQEILAQLNEVRNEVEHLRAENDRLKAEMTPKIEDIAAMDATFRIRYTSYDRNHNRISKSLDLSWIVIFGIVGPSYFKPGGIGIINENLQHHIRRYGAVLPQVDLADTNTIKLQMAAYGFLEIYSAEAVQGGVQEFLRLTDLGKKVLFEVGTSRASPPS